MEELKIEVEPRENTGKNFNRRLRATGQIPAVVYGDGKESVKIQVDERVVQGLLRAAGGGNAVFLLKLTDTDQSRHTMIREMQTDVLTGELIHIDFQRVNMDQKVRVAVAVELSGEPEGVRNEDGLLDFVTREVEIECLPGKIPATIALDVTELHIGQHVEAGELELPEEVTLVEDAERVIVSVAVKRTAAVDEEEEEDLLTTEATEPELVGQEDAAE